jgi:hypothetical protein
MAFFVLIPKRLWKNSMASFHFRRWKMIRQEVVMCQKCGSLKEVSESCECSSSEAQGEKKNEEDWRVF